CSPCNKMEYTEYPNDFSKCMGCWMCREDQVELSPCQADRNTQCACRNGTFCSPDHPCEMCQKCQPQCPPGQVELAPCTPHSDRRCGPPSTSTSSSGYYIWIVGIILLSFVLALVLGIYLYRRFCCRRQGPSDLACASLLSQDYLVQQLMRGRRVGLGTRDNSINEQIVQAKLLSSSATRCAQGPEVPECVPLLHPLGLAGVDAFPKLISLGRGLPVPGKDPIKALRDSFDIFAEEVHVNHWRRFGRALDLGENDIEIILRKDVSHNSFFEMLNLWLEKQGMDVSVNTLLDTLLHMKLRGPAEKVSSKLVQQQLFQHQVS
ncbi:TR10B factor, partial [Upupa epops]|nr:TR10B factor [Upupa epops]